MLVDNPLEAQAWREFTLAAETMKGSSGPVFVSTPPLITPLVRTQNLGLGLKTPLSPDPRCCVRTRGVIEGGMATSNVNAHLPSTYPKVTSTSIIRQIDHHITRAFKGVLNIPLR